MLESFQKLPAPKLTNFAWRSHERSPKAVQRFPSNRMGVGLALWAAMEFRPGRVSAASARRISCRAGTNKEKAESEEASGGLGRNIQQWFQKKKVEGAGGVGGAVLGGMLLGPLGSLVGAQLGTRVAPVLNDVLKMLEGEGAESADPADQADPADPADPSEPPEPTASMPGRETGRASQASQASQVSQASQASQAPRQAASVVRPSLSKDEELRALKHGVQQKQQELELELVASVQQLYEKAQQALRAGDEPAARALLETRAATQASLEKLQLQLGRHREAEERQAERQVALVALEAELAELYRKAEQALASGDELGARELLAARARKMRSGPDCG